MLWHKAWLETRWRFISALLILTIVAGGNVYDYIAAQQLLPRLNATTATTFPPTWRVHSVPVRTRASS